MEQATNVLTPRLATIETIISLSPINGADRIELAQVLGYSVIVEKGLFQVGDLCVWHNPDTVVDSENPVYAMLKKYDYRLRVIKMRGQVSQGLALPLDALNIPLDKRTEGENVTDIVKITKYEKPDPFSGDRRGFVPKYDGLKPWPGFLRKTDETNLRAAPKILQELQQQGECIITKKMDGTSVTIYWFKGQFGVCSRNFELDLACISIPHYAQIMEFLHSTNIEHRLKTLGLDIALQGELCGPKINGMKKNTHMTKVQWMPFNGWDIATSSYMDSDVLSTVVDKLNAIDPTALTVDVVPVVYRGTLKDHTVKSLIEMANVTEYAKGIPGEGIVIRPIREARSNVTKGRLSAKVISEKYCLLHGE